MKKNMWCHFEHEGHKISIHFSTWSGKEVVYVDDHPVSEKRNVLRLTSKHTFMIREQEFSLELEVENPFSYKAQTRLKKGNEVIGTQSTSMFKERKVIMYFIFGLIAGLFFGVYVGRLVGQALFG
jgi:hypothetical protein